MAGRSPVSTGRRRRRRRSRGWSRPSKAFSASPRSHPTSSSSSPPPLAKEPPFPPGAEVEVRVDDDGFHGSWFEATVEAFLPSRGPRCPARYTVTYSHLLADDSGAILVEPFAPSHIRPRPPPPSSPAPLALHDIVEAFHNDGWWSGIVLATDPVTVAFPITREVITFPPRLVRPRRDFVDGQWVPSRTAITVQPKHAVRAYQVGVKVEVVRDRETYGFSWFPATVAKVIDRLSYLVEYYDLEDGDGAGKVTEYLHWRFIRPAVEHSPRESEFKLGPGAAVEVYCDGAWSPGVVRRVVGEGEYEISVIGKEKEELLTKVPELLKPQYKWNGKNWKIVSPKRQGNRRQSLLGKRPSSPVDVASSDDEHRHGTESSAIKRSRKELPQLEIVLTEGSEHASESEMDTTLSALRKSLASNHSLKSSSLLSGKNNFQVLSQRMVSSCAVPMNGLLHASSGVTAPQNDLKTSGIGETLVNHEILSDIMLSDGQLNTPVCETSADEGRAMLSSAELGKQKIVSSRRMSAAQQTKEMPLFVQPLQVKKYTSKHTVGEMHPIQALQGNVDATDNVQLKGNGNISCKEIICALSASAKFNTPSLLDQQIRASDAASRKAGSGSIKEVLTYKKSAKKKSFKDSSSPHGPLDATSTVRQRGRKKVAGQLKESSVKKQLEKRGPLTRQRLNRTLVDKMNVNEATNQELLPIIPLGFESTCNGNGSCEWNADGLSEIDIHSGLMDEELNATINSICQTNEKADASADNVATQVAEITCLMDKPILSLDRPVQQDGGKVDDRPMSQCATDNSILRSCSHAGSSMASRLPLCEITGEQVTFLKTSPIWSLIEAMSVFQKVPQRPHFLPLKQFLPALREGMALGLMVTYANLVESMKRSHIADSIALFEEKISTLAHLEENGFDVQFLQRYLNKLLQIKSDYTKHLGERNKLKEQVLGKTSAVARISALLDEKDEAIFQQEQKLEHLRREAEQIAVYKHDEDAELSRLKAEDNVVQEACCDNVEQFRSILAELNDGAFHLEI